MARLSAKERKALPSSDFAGPGGSFPMEDKEHAQKAVQLEKFASPATKAKINARAKAMGVNVGGDGNVFAEHHKATQV
jgi:hypothetical protein